MSALLALLLAGSGCAPAAQSGSGPASSTPWTAAASPSPDGQTSAQPAPTPSAGDEPVVLDADEWGALVSECISASKADQPLQADEGDAFVARRTVTPEWFVYVPPEATEVEQGYLCTLSGDEDAPVIESWGSSVPTMSCSGG